MKSYTSIHDPKDLLTYEFLTKSLGVKKYDETATYSKGALVYHEDATDTYLDSIFEANQDIATAESWTAAHWDTVDLETIIKRSMHLYEPYMEYDGSIAKEVIYMEKCVIFSGSSAFDLGLVDEKWYGTNLDKSKTGSLEISTDKKTWETWDYKAKGADLQSNGKYEVYVRGKGNNNTCDNATPNPNYSTFTTTAPVNLIGKLDWIIDYTAASPVCGDCSNLFGKVGGSPAKIVDASGFTLSANLDPAAALADFFQDCTTLTTPPTLPAIQISEGCYYGFFIGCTSLKTAPELPATSVAKYCYRDMFVGCTSLTTAPELPAMNLSGCNECYDAMFRGCISLTTAPELPATTIAELCYNQMFQGCTSLTTAPSTLPAEDLTGCNSCYTRMFAGCLALETAPTLPATRLVDNCYQEMFDGCIALKTCPELACTNLAENCYEKMFQGCVALTAPCELPAETLFPGCYRWMFNNCTSITWTTDTSANAYIIPTSGSGTAPTGTTWNEDMFKGNSGTLPGSETTPPQTGTPQINHTYYYETAAPGEDPAGTFTFYNLEHKYPKNDVVITNTLYSTSNIEYSIDGGSTWTTLANGSSTPAAGEVKIRGDIVTFDSGGRSMYPLTITGTRVAVKGQLEDSKDYKFLFIGCAALVDASGLRGAATLAEGCYMYMFNGCANLVSPPTLPATTLAASCYSGMFAGCTSLTTAPALPATTLVEGCYEGIFYSCASLTTPPALPAETLAIYCYASMFSGCTSLTTAPQLPATTLKAYCYSGMFHNCASLVTPPELPAKTLAGKCYNCMFQNCAMLSLDAYGSSYELPAETMYTECYQFMFAGCTSLTETPYILAKTAVDSCFESMFKGCTSLTMVNGGSPMDLTSVGGESCAGMFEGCISLANVDPGLLATVTALSGSLCFMGMFKDCILFNTTLELPVTTLTRYCYQYMFCNCKSLTIPPTLPATTLAEGCYQYMFSGCAHIRKCPELPATTLTGFCYVGMFTNCVSLTELCALPAIALSNGCYQEMFSGCTGIEFASSGTAYRIPTTGTSTAVDPDNVTNMFANCSGTLPGSEKTTPTPGTPQINTTYYYNPQPEEFVLKGKEYMEVISGTAPITGFTVDANGVLSFTRSSIEYVTHIDKSVIFTSPNTFNLQLSGNTWHGDGTLEYSTDGYTWETYGTTNATTLPAPKLQDNGKYELYLRGKGNTTTISGSGDTTQFTTNSTDRINIMGSLDTLLNYTSTPVTTSIMSLFEGANIVDASELVMPTNYNSATGKNSHCAMLFCDCTYLTGAPQFPNVTLATACYRSMFEGCTSLKTPPQLPATQLATSCYQGMFYGSGLTSAPALPATTLANQCYAYMFQNCGSLTTAPALPATTVGECCYSYMFENSGLTTAPELPATTVGVQGYEYMFQNCTALTAAPALPATTLGQQCYECMFLGCTGITKIPALPATTISVYGYRQMFEGCTGLKFYPVGTSASESFTIPSTTTVGTDALQNMFKNCTDFPETGGTPVQGTVYGYGDKLPDPYITIETTDGSDFGIQMVSRVSDVDLTKLEWSTDGTTWNEPGAAGPAIAFPVNSEGSPIYVKKVYVRGNGFTHFAGGYGEYIMTAFCKSSGYVTESVIKISGELRYLYDKSGEATCGNAGSLFAPLQMGPTDVQAVISDVSELVFPTKLGTDANNGLFACMFSIPSSSSSSSYSQPITQPPQLPATQLTESCYKDMFYDCDSLTTAPELPATQLTESCYKDMFYGCTSLTTAPELSATQLAAHCYEYMFSGCTSLTTPPILPATTLADYCYYCMFCYCSSLTTAPELPATTLAEGCYQYMFYGCGFTSAPALPALTVPSGAYVGMFGGCTSLTTPPATLPATTIEIDNTLTYEDDGDGYEWMFDGCTSLTTIPTMPASITIDRTGEYTASSPLAFYQMIEAEEDEPSLDFSKSDKSWTCPTITDTSGAANLSNMFEGQTNADADHGFADGYGTAVATTTYNYGSV